MTTGTDHPTPEAPIPSPPTGKGKKRPIWKRILKWTSIILGSILLLLAIIISVALFYLTPERLTPLVNRYASDYLNAEVKASRIELTFWSSFPKLEVKVDSLDIVSHSLREVPDSIRSTLPENADSLLSMNRFSGGIHVLALAKGTISLYDVVLSNPRVNLVVVSDSTSNFDIFPHSEGAKEPSKLPTITFNRFELEGSMPVRFRMPADSLDLTLTIDATRLSSSTAPVYTINLAGGAGAKTATLRVPTLPFSINGELTWDMNRPENLKMDNFTLAVAGIKTMFDTDISFGKSVVVNSLDLSLPDVEAGRLIERLPESLTGPLSTLQSDLKVSVTASLLQPYTVGGDELPDMQIDVQANATHAVMGAMHLHKFALDMDIKFDGANPDRSVIELKNCEVGGRAMDFDLKGTVTHPVSDPLVDGSFRGSVQLDRLPRMLLDSLPMTLSGRLTGEASVRMRQSFLTPKQFHRIALEGGLSLSDFRMAMRDGSLNSYLHKADFRLGSRSKISVGDHLIDSMLTASLTVDTARMEAPEFILSGRGMSLSAGSRNVAASSDTTQINPLGGTLKAQLLNFDADSSKTRMRLRDAKVKGSLRRFNGEGRSPLLDLDVTAGRLTYRTPDLRAGVSNAEGRINLHPRQRRQMSPRMRAAVDSLMGLYPHLSTDSLRTLARASMPRWHEKADTSGRENIDFEVDQSLSSLLRLWQMQGSLKAERARLYTPYFPLRNRIRDLDMEFSTDSMILHDTYLTVGHSDFKVDGAIRNISRALTSRRHSPIEVDFDMHSDTIDVNEITGAMIRGASYGQTHTDTATLKILTEIEDLEEELMVGGPSTDNQPGGAVVIPSNIKANLRMTANHILYGDLWFRKFMGQVNVFDGAISLDRLRALTDIGSIDMTALYSAPTARDIHFAAGLQLNRLNLHRVLREMPQIDSLIPMLKEVDGIVDARLAVTSDLDSLMNLRFETLDMALQLSGDSLVLLDNETFRTVAKWMMFKNKKRNMIDHMDVEIMVHSGWLELYPVIFDMDRYRLGVAGNNDLNFNLDYHVAVLKSPLPFKFGINIKGTPEHMKIRLGGAKLNEKSAVKTRHLTDSMRVNLLTEMRKAFRRGIRTAGTRGLRMSHGTTPVRSAASPPDDPLDRLSGADSAIFIREGLIPKPEGWIDPDSLHLLNSKHKVSPPEKRKR